MTLTVRLDAALQTALEQHCSERGVTKTLVVQECLASYLVAAKPGAATGKAAEGLPPSAAYRAFADAGLLGAVAIGAVPADKAAVRARAVARLTKNTHAT